MDNALELQGVNKAFGATWAIDGLSLVFKIGQLMQGSRQISTRWGGGRGWREGAARLLHWPIQGPASSCCRR
jgi:antitoxin component of MazEF toxin-antitoxin module